MKTPRLECQPLRVSHLGFTVLLMAASSLSIGAQGVTGFGVVTGTVRDSASAPFRGAEVSASSGSRVTHTDDFGRYVLDSVPVGRTNIFVHDPGSELFRQAGVEVTARTAARVDAQLFPYDYVPPAQRLLATDSGAIGAFAALDTSGTISYPAFSFKLLRATVAGRPDHNMFLSPASAAFALAMTASGASGQTWEAMSKALGLESLRQDALDDRNQMELASLEKQSGVELRIANSIWAAEDRPFLPQFFASARQSYRAEVTSMVLHGESARARINRWVSAATNDRITTILNDTLPDSATLVLLNAVYFKGKWLKPFDSSLTMPHKFRLSKTRVESRMLMERYGSMRYARDSGVRILRLPYQGGRIAMYVVLPDDSVGVEKVVVRLSPERWSRWMSALSNKDVHLQLPRFRMESGAELADPLSQMGMSVAFNRNEATFARMLPESYLRAHPTWISKVTQKTWVEVNEVGTEAAAVTGAIVLSPTSISEPPPLIEFIVDHPFVVAIRDDRTGLLLFLGQITNPTQP